MQALKTNFSRRIVLQASKEAEQLLAQGFGTVLAGRKIQLSLLEAHFLMEQGTLAVLDSRNKPLSAEQFERKAGKFEPHFWIRAVVFSDLRSRGYVVKTGLKFGADFAVYDRGVKPGQDHAQWIVYPVHESERYRWHDFSAKNRVAHTTKKRLLIATVDDERDVTYYEVRWIRP